MRWYSLHGAVVSTYSSRQHYILRCVICTVAERQATVELSSQSLITVYIKVSSAVTTFDCHNFMKPFQRLLHVFTSK
jgi:hypothetical protein